MQKLPKNKELIQLAKRVVWFQKPEDTLDDTLLFAMHTMQYGTLDDLIIFKKYFSKDLIREILEKATAGVLRKRAWNFWHYQAGIFDPPPLPVRTINEKAIPSDILAHIKKLEKHFPS